MSVGEKNIDLNAPHQTNIESQKKYLNELKIQNLKTFLLKGIQKELQIANKLKAFELYTQLYNKNNYSYECREFLDKIIGGDN